jgi:hypothetical protein
MVIVHPGEAKLKAAEAAGAVAMVEGQETNDRGRERVPAPLES